MFSKEIKFSTCSWIQSPVKTNTHILGKDYERSHLKEVSESKSQKTRKRLKIPQKNDVIS